MLVPAGAQYHFGCLFDAVTVAPNSAGWPDLVRSVRAWIARRYSDPALSGRWVFTGGEWRLPGVLRVLVKTQMAVGSGSQDTPQYWAIRYEHPCEDVAARQWR